MMPVDGDSKPRTQVTAGSSARASSAPTQVRSCTPFRSAAVLYDSSVATSASVVATSSLPMRRCGTSASAQYA